MAWSILLPSLAVLEGICIAFDRFMLGRHKSRLYERLLAMWVRLDDARVRDFHLTMARGAHRMLMRLLRPTGKIFLGIVLTALVSAALTTIAVLVDDEAPGLPFSVTFFAIRSAGQLAALYAINAVFDSLTLLCTVLLLRQILVRRRAWFIPIVLLDISLAVSFALLCLLAVDAVTSWAYSTEFVEIRSVSKAIEGSLAPRGYAFASTTLLPTCLYLGILGALFLAKPILRAGKAVARLFIERVTEVDDPRKLVVFSLTGSLVSLLALLVGAAVEIANAVSTAGAP